MRLALVAIMQDEAALIQRWWSGVTAVRGQPFAEVVVVDGGSTDNTRAELAALAYSNGRQPVRVVSHAFTGDFAAQRNFAVDQSSCDWVFELDADEVPGHALLAGLRRIMENAHSAGIDAVGIPRLNFHDGVLQAGVGHCGLDFQYRLHRRACRWDKAVHEEVVGYCARVELELVHGHFIQHLKSTDRHLARNQIYSQIAAGVYHG